MNTFLIIYSIVSFLVCSLIVIIYNIKKVSNFKKCLLLLLAGPIAWSIVAIVFTVVSIIFILEIIAKLFGKMMKLPME